MVQIWNTRLCSQKSIDRVNTKLRILLEVKEDFQIDYHSHKGTIEMIVDHSRPLTPTQRKISAPKTLLDREKSSENGNSPKNHIRAIKPVRKPTPLRPFTPIDLESNDSRSESPIDFSNLIAVEKVEKDLKEAISKLKETNKPEKSSSEWVGGYISLSMIIFYILLTIILYFRYGK